MKRNSLILILFCLFAAALWLLLVRGPSPENQPQDKVGPTAATQSSPSPDTVFASEPSSTPNESSHALSRQTVPSEPVPVVHLPPIDREAQAKQIAEKEAVGLYTFAQAHEVHITPEANGRWIELSDGRERWELGIDSPDALSLNFAFKTYRMPEGGRLEITDGAGAKHWRAFTAADNEEHGELWTPLLFGSIANLSVTLPAGTRPELGLVLSSVNRGFRGTNSEKIGDGSSGPCNIDVVCDTADIPIVGRLIDQRRDQIRSVGAYTIRGIDTCSGALIANAEQDGRPFFLTADHCQITSGNAPSMVTYWNFENTTCRQPNSSASGSDGDGPISQFNSGSIFRCAYPNSDMTLVEMDDDINSNYNVFFSGWDRSGDLVPSAFCIHHPSVAEKRISFEQDPVSFTFYLDDVTSAGATHIRVADWDYGTTEGGSSGSPLFDPNGRIIGQLHGGGAACGNNLPDWYGRFSVSWNAGGDGSSSCLKNWLDPQDTGVETVDGHGQDESLSIEDASVVESNNGTTLLTFTVTLSSPSTEIVSLDWDVEEDTALAGSDFPSAQGGRLTIPPNTTMTTFDVIITGDTEVEENETFNVVLSNAQGALLADDTAVGTIENDDFADPPEISSPLTAFGMQGSQFTYQIEASNTPTSFEIENGPDGMFVDSTTGEITWLPSMAGAFSVDISATNPVGTDTDTLQITVTMDALITAVDGTGFALVPGSDWFSQTTVTHDGVDAAQAGAISDDGISDMSIQVQGPNTVRFWWRVSSEQGFDFLQLLLDGVVVTEISGELDWQSQSVTVPSGDHTVTWRYTKDDSFREGSDTAWVDEIEIDNVVVGRAPQLVPAGTQTGLLNTPFAYLATATGSPTSFSATGLPPGISIESSTGLVSGIPTVLGTTTATISAMNSFGSDSIMVEFVFRDTVEIGVDAISLSWRVFGPQQWYSQSETSRDGVDAAQSGAIGDGQETDMSVTLAGPGDLKWWWKVDSQPTGDVLQLLLDGTVIPDYTISGTVPWRPGLLAIPAGNHTITWRYSKDVAHKDGLDAGWVDQVSFTPFSMSNLPVVNFENGQFNIEFAKPDGASGYDFIVERSNFLDPDNWISTGIVITDNDASTLRAVHQASTSGLSQQFFRVRAISRQ